jgi:hypothetical protein
MCFDVATTRTAARLPNKLSTLLHRVEVLCGGQSIMPGFNGFNLVKHIKEVVHGSDCLKTTRAITNHENVCETTDFYGENIASNDPEAYNAGPSFMYTFDLGFMGEVSPKVLDTALVPEITLRITLASSDVLVSSVGGADFTLSNIYFTVVSYSVDGVYETLVEQRIRDRGFLEIPYKAYHTFQNRHTNNTRFSASSQSIDALYAVLRPSTYNDQGAAEDISTGDVGPVYPSKLAKFLNCGKNGLTEYQYTINNQLYPSFRAKPLDAYKQLMLTSDKNTNEIPNYRAYLENYFIIPQMLAGDMVVGHINGADSRNTSSVFELNTVGVGANVDSFIVVESTQTLKIGAGKAMKIVM